MNLNATLVELSLSYSLQLAGKLTMGDIAAHFARREPHVSGSTLEVAMPARNAQHLQELDWRSGDRLAVFTQPARANDAQTTLKPGDKFVRLRRGDFEITSQGKKGLLLGRPDDTGEATPDVDLRYFVAPGMMDYISRACLWLQYDESNRIWYISRPGQTRVMIDEFELGTQRLPIEGSRHLRFYPPPDTRDFPTDRLIGEMLMQVDEVQKGEERETLPSGNYRLRVQVGTEREMMRLNASGNVTLRQLAEGLASQHGIAFNATMPLYLLRLVHPDLTVQELSPGAGMFLYAARQIRYAPNLLLLRDVSQRDRVYTLAVGLEDDEKIVGCRINPAIPDPTLDVDLYESFLPYRHQLTDGVTVPHYLGRIIYRAAENSWSFRLDEEAQMPIFVNNGRGTLKSALRLGTGDVLSFSSGGQDFVRLEVEITARAN
jgi:hypothetical protein